MKGAVVPSKYGWNLVMLPPYTNHWRIQTPVEIPQDLELIAKSEVLRKLAIYAHQLSGWQGQLAVALPWALWGGFALWMRLSNYASMGGWKIIALYGWIMFLFFADGVWALGRLINQIPNLLRVRQIKCMDNVDITYHDADWEPLLMDAELTEREYVAQMAQQHPSTQQYYDEMLRVEPPLAFSLWPLGLLGYVKYLLAGPKIPRPCISIELGRLE